MALKCRSGTLLYTEGKLEQTKYRNIMIRYSQAMPTFVVHDQLLLRDVVGCVLCAFAQRTHQLVLHDKEAYTHPTARTAGYFWGLLDEHSTSASPVQKCFPGHIKLPSQLSNRIEFENLDGRRSPQQWWDIGQPARNQPLLDDQTLGLLEGSLQKTRSSCETQQRTKRTEERASLCCSFLSTLPSSTQHTG